MVASSDKIKFEKQKSLIVRLKLEPKLDFAKSLVKLDLGFNKVTSKIIWDLGNL